MTREQQHRTDEEILDQQWDALVTGRVLVAEDPTIRELHSAPGPAAPTPMFRNQLRSMLEMAAQDQAGDQQSSQIWTYDSALPVTKELPLRPLMRPAGHRPGRMRGLSRGGKVVSVLLAASLLVAIAGAMIRYPFGDSNGTGAPTNQPQGTSIAAVSSPVIPNAGEMASSADPGRTNVQLGPAPIGIPDIVGQADVRGDAMALGGGALVIVDNDTVTALDATSLDQKWSVEVPYGFYTAPVIAGDAVYFGFTGQRDGATEWVLGPDESNQLVSLSLKDGSENWRIDDAGAAPVAPVVVNGTIYAVGTTKGKDAYRLGAFDGADGHTLWTADPFTSDPMPEISYPKVIPYIWMTLAYGEGLIAVNQIRELSVFNVVSGKELWSHTVEKPDVVGRPLIDGGAVIATMGHSPADNGTPGAGKIVALDLQTGVERWSIDNQAGYSFGTAAGGNAVAAAQINTENVQLLTVMDSQSGDERWSLPSRDTTADPGPNFWQLPDTMSIVGDLTLTVGQASNGGKQSRTLVTARYLETGEVAWTVVIDGTAQGAPIVADGKIYVLTDLYGLQVLGSTEAPATPSNSVADLRGPDECAATPIENPLLGAPEADGTPIPEWARWGEIMPLTEVPEFDSSNAVTPDIADGIGDVIAGYRACMAQGDPQVLFSIFSDDYWRRLRGMDGWNFDGKNGESGQTAVMLAGSNERIDLDPATLQVWTDGRVGGLVHGDTDIYVWFVDEDGTWKIDEFHRIMDTTD